jgi:hypothetical protein
MALQRAAENGGVGRQSERGNCTRTIGATHPERRNVIVIVIVAVPIPVVVWVCVNFDIKMDVVHTQVFHEVHVSTLEAYCAAKVRKDQGVQRTHVVPTSHPLVKETIPFVIVIIIVFIVHHVHVAAAHAILFVESLGVKRKLMQGIWVLPHTYRYNVAVTHTL